MDSKPNNTDFFTLKEANGFITSKMWNKMHRLCPKCKSNMVAITLRRNVEYSNRDYTDDINNASCTDCNWSGKVMDLVCE